MNLTITIFKHEWKQLIRQKWLLVCLLLFLLIGLTSLYTGRTGVNIQLVQVDSIHANLKSDFDAVLAKFSDTSAKGKKEALNAGIPAFVNFKLAPNAIKQPAPLAPLALGLADLQPWNTKIKWTKDYKDEEDSPVSNPMALFSGNFDLSFVMIYLLPLMIILFGYSLFSTEKESGTLFLLIVQAGNLRGILLRKLIFRCLLLAIVVLTLDVTAFVFAAIGSVGMAGVYWTLLSLLYLAFWAAGAYLVISLRKSATVTGLYLISAWLFLLVVSPSLVNTYVEVTRPVPMKHELASYRRHQGEEIWKTHARILSDSFNSYFPQYNATIDLSKDTQHLSERYIGGYYALLDRRMARVLVSYDKKIADRNRRFALLSGWNPASNTQTIFNELACNNLTAYQDFNSQSDFFQKKWQSFLYDFNMNNRKLKAIDFYRLPAFTYRPPRPDGGSLIMYCIYLLLLATILGGIGHRLFNKSNLT